MAERISVNDGQKSEFASQRQARLLGLQQIPSSVAAYRAHLIKRAGQPDGEGM